MRVTNHIVGGCPDGCCRFEPIMVLSRSLQLFTPRPERTRRQAPRMGLTDRRRFANNLREERFDLI